MYSTPVVIITATEARAALPELLDRVQAGEEVTITRHGQPVAVVVRPDSLRTRRAGRAQALAESVKDALDAGRSVSLSSIQGLTPAYADALVAEVRAGRDRG